jgi:DNA repair exonuclease SbcCD nuclease subunit
MTIFVHTADWQLGKPFGAVADPEKRAELQRERFAVIDRIGAVVRQSNATFVVVAGDLFDSPSPARTVVSQACAAIGRLEVPVYVIPGNHDYGGPLGPWQQRYFLQERDQLAPNLQVLLSATPVELPDALLFPCPLLRRHESEDLTTWLRHADDQLAALPAHKPRIVLAHGSVADFRAASEEDDPTPGINHLDLGAVDQAQWDYIALGDWHGCKQVGPKAWYAGTPEPDRFPRGAEYEAGRVLVVTASRGQSPTVMPFETGGIGWHRLAHTFLGQDDLDALEGLYNERINSRVSRDLLRLELEGSLGMTALGQLDQLMQTWETRLLRLDRRGHVAMAATEEDIATLTERTADPLTARIATMLRDRLSDSSQSAEAEACLRALHLAVTGEG